jgi:phage terminase large subunit-like protein
MDSHVLDIECAFDKLGVLPVYSLPDAHELLDSLLSFPHEKHDIFW